MIPTPKTITCITITARKNAMFDVMAKSLRVAMDAVGPGGLAGFQWIVVDALLWEPGGRLDVALDRDDMRIFHVPPKPSAWHGPWAQSKTPRPDHNGARNTGLIYALGDYVVFLDDCSMVSPSFLDTAIRAANMGVGARFRHRYIHMGDATPFETKERPPVEIDPTSMRGSAVGYPLEALLDVNGFDEAYGGEVKEDFEIAIRMSRLGLTFYEFPNVEVREYAHDPIFTDQRGSVSIWNDARLSQLLADKKQIQPYARQADLRLLREPVLVFKKGDQEKWRDYDNERAKWRERDCDGGGPNVNVLLDKLRPK